MKIKQVPKSKQIRKSMPMRKRIPSHDVIDPVRGQMAAKKAAGIEIDVKIVAIHASDPQEILKKRNMHTTTITLPEKTVVIGFPVESTMTAEVDMSLSFMVQTMITITMDHHQMDTIQTLATPTIAATVNLFLIAREMDLHLSHVPIPVMAPHPETFEGEVDRIRRTGTVVLLHGSIRIEISMGHRGVARLHHATIDANTGIDRSVLRIQKQKETMDVIRFENLPAVAQVEKIKPGLRDRTSTPRY
jgi:hypothetical protein